MPHDYSHCVYFFEIAKLQLLLLLYLVLKKYMIETSSDHKGLKTHEKNARQKYCNHAENKPVTVL